MKPAKLGLLLLLATSSVAMARAGASDADVQVSRHPDRTYEISGSFTVDASTAAAWDVLTDYDHIPRFVSSMRSSRIRDARADGTVEVEQVAVGDMFFLTKKMRVRLEVRRAAELLSFKDVGGEDFLSYDGSWEVRPAAVGTSVNYRLFVSPRFAVPSFLLSRAMKKGARNLLEQVRTEVVRRGAEK